jgi:hypothetical protein
MTIRSMISPEKWRNQNISSDSIFSRSPRNKHRKLMRALAKPAAFLVISREKTKPVSCRYYAVKKKN